ncbi:AraC family transcriptional regulator [Paraburkholderia tropica]|uniref:AraC family transcriptional regulator n=1 Tax=Paraburkholderia tropica TaxID=92647 RepID=UPI001CAF6871|nr:helix-turn-helix transcriptional regulator [Paraburkholderia tropica]CAG9220557.1 AraC family transcriptional regulator [Paraburkholderia tropica]
MPSAAPSRHSPAPPPARSTDPADYQGAPGPASVLAKEYADGFEVGEHRHARAQLIYATRGVIEVSVAHTLWLVPPQRALWMPADTPHAMRARGAVSLRSPYIRAEHCPPGFPAMPHAVNVTPLLRELIVRAASIPVDDEPTGRDALVIAHLLAEIDWVPGHPLRMPAGGDRRLKRICDAILHAPADPRTLDAWAAEAGASTRTLARLFLAETGLSFVHWRQLVRVQHALPLLASGLPVADVSAALGYDTPGAFAAMFRRVTGSTPSAYFSLPDVSLSDPA